VVKETASLRQDTRANWYLSEVFPVPTRAIIAALLLCSLAGLCQAKPAYWYRWQSKTAEGVYICTQSYPGHGWVRIAGPFARAGCKTY
jgi:hypothetical protein